MWSGLERCSIRNGVSQQDTLADVEHISTIAGSLGSIGTTESQGADEALYDTDHTDLNSDFDEAELRRELLKDVIAMFLFRSYIRGSLTRIHIPEQKNRNGGTCSTSSIRRDSAKYPSRSSCWRSSRPHCKRTFR